ncbi:ATP-binding protein [Ornithinimicrobium sp. LYQ103]|uniref:ATP-binding protein n=1 Tax=Ornithinimicrobium sp. LYQ103 TaxID=3378796 RepID=UPI0038552E03
MSRRTPNPYRPGFNQAPARLVGRDAILAAAAEALEIAAFDGRTPRPLLLVGPRGVGKTVLLGEIATVAAQGHGWPTVAVEIRPGTPFTAELVERLRDAATLLRQATVEKGGRLRVSGGKVSAKVFGVGGEVDVVRSAAGSAAVPLDEALSDAADAATACGGGLVITVDELQLADRAELANLAAVLQQHVADHWPLVVAGAGLPSLRERDRTVTYLERGEWHELGLLEPADTREALVAPAADAGRPMDEAAADVLTRASGGYPYAVQVLGHHAWRASHGQERIGVVHACAALSAAQRDLSAGLYASRWNDASPKEREYLAALAHLPEGAGGGDVARELGQPTSGVSYLRDRLIKKGTLFPERGALRFLVPGMARWIREQADA